jgi:hypothetical protein
MSFMIKNPAKQVGFCIYRPAVNGNVLSFVEGTFQAMEGNSDILTFEGGYRYTFIYDFQPSNTSNAFGVWRAYATKYYGMQATAGLQLNTRLSSTFNFCQNNMSVVTIDGHSDVTTQINYPNASYKQVPGLNTTLQVWRFPL